MWLPLWGVFSALLRGDRYDGVDNYWKLFLTTFRTVGSGWPSKLSVVTTSSCQWLTIPYVGYLELDVELCGRLVIGCGVLVVQDPSDGMSLEVPGVLGMNILGRCYQELFGQHGSALFDLPVITQLPGVSSALQYCRQVSTRKLSDPVGCVRVRRRRVCRIPGGTMKLVAATCSAQYFGLFHSPHFPWHTFNG